MTNRPWDDNAVAARELARRVMRAGRSPWIDIAIREGWSASLEGLFRSAAFEASRDGPLPPLSRFDAFSISQKDAEYFARHGQKHLPSELEDITAARAKLPKPQPLAERMTGETAS